MISVLTLDEADKWDSIVKSFESYDVYYLSGYIKAFEFHGDGEPHLIHYQDQDINAINVVMKRDIESDNSFQGQVDARSLYDFATPYGYGGFLIEGVLNEDNLKKLNEAYENYCSTNNIVSEFVRFNPVLENSNLSKAIYEVHDLGSTITIDLISKEHIWDNLSGKNRNVIRKAMKSGVEIYWGRSTDLIEAFIPLYNATMDKDNATDYYYFDEDFYKSVLEDLKYNSMFFYALFETKIISMSIILFGNNKMHYHLSASDREYQNLAATNLLLYEAACWGCENGYKRFHLGGGLGSEEDGLYKFKKAFNKNSQTFFSIGKKIFDAEKYQELVDIRKTTGNYNSETGFFPAYRG